MTFILLKVSLIFIFGTNKTAGPRENVDFIKKVHFVTGLLVDVQTTAPW